MDKNKMTQCFIFSSFWEYLLSRNGQFVEYPRQFLRKNRGKNNNVWPTIKASTPFDEGTERREEWSKEVCARDNPLCG